jgi:RNA polymerase sigma-70 factor (ECF subfamily)
MMLAGMPRAAAPLDAGSFAPVLAAAQAGEQWAIESLFVDTQPRLLRFLRSAEPRAADDLAGEVWLAIARSVRGFVGGLPEFRGWVFTIARRRLADHRRTAVRRATDVVDAMSLHQLAAADDPATETVTGLSGQEAADRIRELLPREQAEVVLLRVVAELDVAHVADALGRSANWVRVTQHRALIRLERALAGGRENPLQGVIPDQARTI